VNAPAVMVCQFRLIDLLAFVFFAAIGLLLGYFINKRSGQSFNLFKIMICLCFGFVGFSAQQFRSSMCEPDSFRGVANG
jgi:hypothetical protein